MKSDLENKETKLVQPSSSDLPFQLDLLSDAKNYQKWVMDTIFPYLGNRILEIGAGTGNMSRWLPLREKLILAETEDSLVGLLEKTMQHYFQRDQRVEAVCVDLSVDWKKDLVGYDVDTIVSFNVLEHIEDDRKAYKDWLWILKNSKSVNKKRLITFVPAHQFAFGTFDAAYGHFRRYTKKDLKRLQSELIPEAHFYSRYFNIPGLVGWTFYSKFLRTAKISNKSVATFEKICPMIRRIDDALHTKLALPLGQSVFSVVEFD